VSDRDCTCCGACCFSSALDYIPVFAVDEARMDDRALALTEIHAGSRHMRFSEGRCAALSISDGRLRCRIYQERPDACRWLQPESGACLQQIAEKGEMARLCALSASR
jgi:hypothetical protein